MNGILPLWKPKGFTSHDCVGKARGILRTKKIGHTGTLDPEVEGVLPLCVGKATKIVPYLTDTDKVYEATVFLGTSTETEDASGKIITKESVSPPPTLYEIKGVLRRFTGTITQVPPMYSAVKVKGRKLYEYARAGEPVERPQREVVVKEIVLHEDTLRWQDDTCSFNIRVVCSKGTYIRTLCVDIGEALGFPAHMSFLERTKTGSFDRSLCYTFEEIEATEHKESLLLPIHLGLSHLPTWSVDEKLASKVRHGQVLEKNLEEETVVLHEGEVLAIYIPHPSKPGMSKPARVF